MSFRNNTVSMDKSHTLIRTIQIPILFLRTKIKNAILLLETLLDINERLHSYLDNCIVNFDEPIKNLEKYLENHKKLWLARNIKEGYAFSANRINWLIEMLMCLDRKEKI